QHKLGLRGCPTVSLFLCPSRLGGCPILCGERALSSYARSKGWVFHEHRPNTVSRRFSPCPFRLCNHDNCSSATAPAISPALVSPDGDECSAASPHTSFDERR